MMPLSALLSAILVPLAPYAPQPDPTPFPYSPGVNLLPNYTVNGDGTRMQCSPDASTCWRDTTGLPSYLQGV